MEAVSFYGEVRARTTIPGAVLTRLSHGQGRRLPLHTHRPLYYALLLRGGYRERFRGGEIDCAPMTLVFHPPETRHVDEIPANGAAFFAIELDPSWLDQLPQKMPMPSVSVLPSESMLLALQLWNAHSRFSIESLVFDLLSQTMRVQVPAERGAPPWLDRVADRLRADFDNPPPFHALAHEAGVHPAHLSRVFRQKFGITMAQYIHRLRVDAALRSMTSGSRPSLSELALQTGFADQSHFTRVFKRLTGSSPGRLGSDLTPQSRKIQTCGTPSERM